MALKGVMPLYEYVAKADPKKAYSFIVVFDLPSGLSEILGRFTNATNTVAEKEQFGIGLSDLQKTAMLLSLAVRSIADVGMTIQTASDEVYNQRVQYAMHVTYPDTVQITFREYVASPVWKILKAWQSLAVDPTRGRVAHKADYVGTMYKIEFDEGKITASFSDAASVSSGIFNTQYKVLETVMNAIFGTSSDIPTSTIDDGITNVLKFENVFLDSAPLPASNYANKNALIDVTATFRFDRVEPVDWNSLAKY